MDDHQKGQNNTQEHQKYAEAEKEAGRVHKVIFALSGVPNVCRGMQSKRGVESNYLFS